MRSPSNGYCGSRLHRIRISLGYKPAQNAAKYQVKYECRSPVLVACSHTILILPIISIIIIVVVVVITIRGAQGHFFFSGFPGVE